MISFTSISRIFRIVTPKSKERASRHWANLLLLALILFTLLGTYGGYAFYRVSGERVREPSALSPVSVETIEREKLSQILEKYRTRKATYEDALTKFVSIVDPSR